MGSNGTLAGMRNNSMGPPYGIDPTTHHIIRERENERERERHTKVYIKSTKHNTYSRWFPVRHFQVCITHKAATEDCEKKTESVMPVSFQNKIKCLMKEGSVSFNDTLTTFLFMVI